MTDIAFFANGSRSEPFSSPLNVLERAIAKLVVLGDAAGVSSEQMILLLDAGMTVPELLEYVLTRAEESPVRKHSTSVRLCCVESQRSQHVPDSD